MSGNPYTPRSAQWYLHDVTGTLEDIFEELLLRDERPSVVAGIEQAINDVAFARLALTDSASKIQETVPAHD